MVLTVMVLIGLALMVLLWTTGVGNEEMESRIIGSPKLYKLSTSVEYVS